MAIKELVSQEDLVFYEIMKNPVLFGEFVYNMDRLDREEKFAFTVYQKEFLLDVSNYQSLACGRAVGKTLGLSILMIWYLVFNVFPNDYILYTVPSKVHLEPVFTNLIRLFRSNSFLKQFIEPRGGINGSDYTVKLLNQATLLCRIAGQSGTGANVIGLHTPVILLDECIVAGQGVACPRGSRKIADLAVGDKILSWNGEDIEEDSVISVQKVKRNQRVLEIETNSGKIKVGENHRFYTDSGYVEAGTLNVGDTLYSIEPPKHGAWTNSEISYVKNATSNGVPVYEIAKTLHRTAQSIFRKIARLGTSVRGSFDDVPLTSEQYQIIAGSLLGDGSAGIEINRARYHTNHSLKQKEYVDWLRSKLGRLVRAEPRISKNGGWGEYNYSFGTLGHPEILALAEELYINGKKTVTRSYLDRLDSLGLAVWFMDDGSTSGMWSTHSFSEEENKLIQEYLLEKWGIESTVYFVSDKNLYCILVKNSSLKVLRKIITPYIPECMQYKVGNGTYNNTIPEIEVVKNAEKKETLLPRKILSIRVIKRTKAGYLYTLEVEKNHNYFVGGILTKNSGYYPHRTFQELQPSLNTFTPGFKLLTSGVPTGLREGNVLYHTDQENSSYSKHRVSALQNPRFSEEDKQRALEQYGGEDSEDYIHFVCFTPETPIITSSGIKPISKVASGDIVLTHTGNWKKVTNTFSREYSGKILGIKTERYYNPIWCTPEHPVYAKRLKKVSWKGNSECALWKGNIRRVRDNHKNAVSLLPEFVLASKLERLDRVSFPKATFTKKLPARIDLKDLGTVRGDYVYTKVNARFGKSRLVSKTPRYLEVTDDFLFFIGIFIAEGGNSLARGQCSISLNVNEINIKNKVIAYLKSIGQNHWVTVVNNSLQVCFGSRTLSNFLSKFVGCGAENKHIPAEFLGVDSRELLPLLDGLFSGDGSCRVKKHRFEASYTTISKRLADDILFILYGLGVRAELLKKINTDYKYICANKKPSLGRPVYTLRLGHTDIAAIYTNKVSIENTFDDGSLAIPIKKIGEAEYTGLVYNLEVEDDNSYVTCGFSAHNCGLHGKPVFSLFDRGAFEIINNPVYKLVINGWEISENIDDYITRANLIPQIPDKSYKCIIGIDLGYTEPTAIIILYQDGYGRIKFHARITLNKVSYTIQDRFIDLLDSKFKPYIIGIDEGGVGKPVVQRLKESLDYAHKDYHKRLIPINFSTAIVMGTNSDGEEIKTKTKPLAVSVLQEYANNHKVVFSSTDFEMVTELERMTYSKTVTGEIVYKTLTERGGKKGEDHFTAALLCAILAYYLVHETMDFTKKRQKLMKSSWFAG